MSRLSRRNFIAGASAAGLAPLSKFAVRGGSSSTFMDINRPPDLVRAFGAENKEIPLTKQPDSWEGTDIRVTYRDGKVALRASTGVTRIQLRWHGDLSKVKLFQGDDWERSYADLEWRGEAPDRPMPWYFLAFDGHRTDAFGVMVQPNALCFWNADSSGISLWADVRNGGSPVLLSGRELAVCTVVCRLGRAHESAFEAAREFCKLMCPKPGLPRHTVFGTNDWYLAYGKNSRPLIEKMTSNLVELCPPGAKPYSVIDDGWEPSSEGRGPWDRGNEKFGDMAKMADSLVSLGARPGIWFRPLISAPEVPDTWRLSRSKDHLDPSIPEVLAKVSEDTKRLFKWGYRLLKHDYSTYDLLGRWGFRMGQTVTDDGWHFADQSRTTAEIMLDLYRTIREGAGNALVLGCNTMSHLSAGIFELNRIGDDTSGVSWNRTRRMGVNTLAFRGPQNGTFYMADPDVAGVTKNLPWELAERWLRLVSMSGLPLFVSADPEATGPAQKAALREALARAAVPQGPAEPLDWMSTMCPREWKTGGKPQRFEWMDASGPWPFND